MEHSWMLKYFAEFFGTLIMVMFGNGGYQKLIQKALLEA